MVHYRYGSWREFRCQDWLPAIAALYSASRKKQESGRLNVFAGHNLLNNAALLVEAGLGYVVCVGGSFEIRGGENLCFIPLSPERTTGHVLAWKKNRVFHRFRDFIGHGGLRQ